MNALSGVKYTPKYRITFLWLWDTLQEEENEILQKTIKSRLKVFERVIIQTNKPYRALMIDFKKYPYSIIDPEKVNWNE